MVFVRFMEFGVVGFLVCILVMCCAVQAPFVLLCGHLAISGAALQKAIVPAVILIAVHGLTFVHATVSVSSHAVVITGSRSVWSFYLCFARAFTTSLLVVFAASRMFLLGPTLSTQAWMIAGFLAYLVLLGVLYWLCRRIRTEIPLSDSLQVQEGSFGLLGTKKLLFSTGVEIEVGRAFLTDLLSREIQVRSRYPQP